MIPALFQTDCPIITNKYRKKNIILGWNSKATLIAKQLDNYVSDDSELHILTNNDKATKIISTFR
jgi:hypothetical protein